MQPGSAEIANNVTMVCRSTGDLSQAPVREMQERSELQDITEKLENLSQSDVKSKTVHLQKSLSKLHAEVEWPVKTAAASRSPRLTKI